MKERNTFGLFMLGLRKDRKETLQTMANKIGVTQSLLSGYETSRRPLPEDLRLFHRVSREYNLTERQQDKLLFSILDNLNSFKIDLRHISNSQRYYLIKLVLNFHDMSDDQITEVLSNAYKTT